MKAQHPDSDAASDAILRPTLQEEAVSGLISKLFKGIYHNILVNIKLSNSNFPLTNFRIHQTLTHIKSITRISC